MMQLTICLIFIQSFSILSEGYIPDLKIWNLAKPTI